MRKYAKIFLLVVTISFIAYLPMWQSGFPLGHDFSLEIIRLVEYKEALFTQVFPRLAPDLYMGYGSPIFVFYSPVFLLFTALLSSVVDFYTAIKIVVFFLGIVSSISFYSFLHKKLSESASIFGALLFSIAPYKFIDLFSRNAFAEYTAFMLLPIVLWTVVRVIHDPRPKNYILFFGTFFFFLLSHNITVMISTPFIVMTALYFFWEKYGTLRHSELFSFALTLVLSIGSASFFLIPAILEGSIVHIGDVTLGKFAYDRNFLDLMSAMFDPKTLIFISPVILLLPIANSIAGMREGKRYLKNISGFFTFLMSLFCFFMMLPLSEWIWKLFPMLSLVQFPWRFMVLFTFFALWNTSYLFDVFFLKIKKWGYVFIGITMVTLLITHLLHFKNWDHYTERIPEPSQIASENKRTTVGNEYLIKKIKDEPSELSDKAIYQVPGKANTFKKCLFDTSLQGAAVFPLHYFPYWKAYVDNREVAINAKSPLITVPLSEPACVLLVLGFSNVQIIAFCVSLFSIILFVGALIYFRNIKKIYKKNPQSCDWDFFIY